MSEVMPLEWHEAEVRPRAPWPTARVRWGCLDVHSLLGQYWGQCWVEAGLGNTGKIK